MSWRGRRSVQTIVTRVESYFLVARLFVIGGLRANNTIQGEISFPLISLSVAGIRQCGGVSLSATRLGCYLRPFKHFEEELFV